MVKQTVKYTDYDGEAVEEALWFNLTKAELMELDKKYNGKMGKYLSRWNERQENTRLGVFFKDLILRAYGRKSEDGRRFEKSPEATLAFAQSAAFEALFDDLLASPEAAEAFVTGVMSGMKPLPLTAV